MKQLVVAAVICVAFAAHATVLVPLDTKALTARASSVVLGTVESQVARWTDDRQAIFTDVTIRVTRAYKGTVKPGERVVVRREGGVIDGVGMRVFGAASFSVGEEVVVFLEMRGGAPYTVGMTQGKLRVFTGDDGIKHVSASLGDVAFTRADAAKQTLQPPRRLDDLEREVRGYVKGAQ
jgi:hypothetical protein